MREVREGRVQTPVGERSRAKQSFKDECDVNVVVRRYAQTGMFDHVAKRQPTYGDVSNAVDLQTALRLVETARESFMELPARVRRAASNDPVELLAMLADPDQVAELVELGLPVEKPAEAAAAAVSETPKASPAPAPREPVKAAPAAASPEPS